MGEKITHWYFKLFNSIKSEHEAEDFAKLELLSLFGRVEPIRNFVDKLMEELKVFTKDFSGRGNFRRATKTTKACVS